MIPVMSGTVRYALAFSSIWSLLRVILSTHLLRSQVNEQLSNQTNLFVYIKA